MQTTGSPNNGLRNARKIARPRHLCKRLQDLVQHDVACSSWPSQRRWSPRQRQPRISDPKIAMIIFLYQTKFWWTVQNNGRVLYGAGAETPIFVTGTSRKITESSCLPTEKSKSAVYTQKAKKNRCLGIRCWDPNLSSGYQNCGLGTHRWEFFQNRSGGKLGIFLKSLGGSQRPALYKNPAVTKIGLFISCTGGL